MQFKKKKQQRTIKENDPPKRSDNIMRSWIDMYKIMRGVEYTVHSEHQYRRPMFKTHGLGTNEGQLKLQLSKLIT